MKSNVNDSLSDSRDTWIKVYVRVRPMLRSEVGQERILEVEGDNRTVSLDGSSTYTFKQTFDRAFGESSEQYQLFEDFKQHSQLVLQGYNFSDQVPFIDEHRGKTYTMFGNDWENMIQSGGHGSPVKIQHQSTFFEDIATDRNNAGMIPRSIYHIFSLVEQQNKNTNSQSFVYCSFLQIYNEKIYDLLVESDYPVPLSIHESRLDGVFVEGLSEYAVNHYYDCLTLMKRGEKNRFIRSTSMNAKSSRSHTIFQVLIEASKADESGNLKRSKINLCDLAGSEKANRNEQMKKVHLTELININQSLTTLGKVIQNLSQNSSRRKLLPIPYRESKLTRLLQDSLGGNTQTYFIANVSSSVYHLDETYSTLKFAERAKNITIQIAPNKIDARSSDLVNKLTKEINYLKSLLHMKRNGINTNDVHFKMMKLQEENDRLRNQTVSVGDVEKLIAENRSMKIEIQKLYQSVTLGSADGLSQQSAEHINTTENFASTDMAESLSLKILSLKYLIAVMIVSNSSQFHKPSYGSKAKTSTFRNGGMMVINNFASFPKTEVAVRVKGRNNQYQTKRGYVEQSERQHARESNLKHERQRVLERLQALESMKRENESRLRNELDQIELRSRSTQPGQYEKYEIKEKRRLQQMDHKLKIIETALILD